MDVPKTGKTYGLLAEFANPGAIFHAAETVRDSGYTHWDTYTPYPVHGLDKAMGLKPSRLPFVVLVMGLTGASLAMLVQWWTQVVAQPLVISGKPFFSWQAFIPVTFELGILFGALGAVFGMLQFNKLPTYYHPLFRSKRFERVTNDGFFLAIESEDPKYDASQTQALLESLGAVGIETVED